MKTLFVSGILVLLSALSINTSSAETVAELCGDSIIFSAQDINHKTQIDVCLEDENTVYLVLNGVKAKPATEGQSDQFDFVFEGNPRNTSWLDNSTDLTIASLMKFTNRPQKEKYVISAGKNSEGKVYGFFYIYSGTNSPVKTALDPKTIKSFILEMEDTNFPETE